jgi:hypothetical protein
MNIKTSVCLDIKGVNVGGHIGVSGCHHKMGNQVKF